MAYSMPAYSMPVYSMPAQAYAPPTRAVGSLQMPAAQIPQMGQRPVVGAQTQPFVQPYAAQSASMPTPMPRVARLSSPAAPQSSMPSVKTSVQSTLQGPPMPMPLTASDRTIAPSHAQVLQEDAVALNNQAFFDKAVDKIDAQEWDRQVTEYMHGIRTAKDDGVPAARALQKLQQGNERFVNGTPAQKTFCVNSRSALATYGQRPMATIIGCADSRCGTDVVFDAHPGDLFVLRNAGNTLTMAEGSMVGSAEYSVCNLGAHLIVVLGHTHCGAIAGATKCMLDRKGSKAAPSGTMTTLQSLLADLEPVAAQAQLELEEGAKSEDIAAHAVYVNVFNTIEKLFAYSEPIREKCREGALEVHGAVYDIVSGRVDFLGQHPRLPLLLGTQSGLMHIAQKAMAERENARAQ